MHWKVENCFLLKNRLGHFFAILCTCVEFFQRRAVTGFARAPLLPLMKALDSYLKSLPDACSIFGRLPKLSRRVHHRCHLFVSLHMSDRSVDTWRAVLENITIIRPDLKKQWKTVKNLARLMWIPGVSRYDISWESVFSNWQTRNFCLFLPGFSIWQSFWFLLTLTPQQTHGWAMVFRFGLQVFSNLKVDRC